MDNKIAPPGSAEEQHQRVAALRKLVARGIPCILWGEDAIRYAPIYRDPTVLFDQHILVPDHLLEQAAAVLRESLYGPISFEWSSLEFSGPLKGTSPFPKGIRLKHRDVPEEEPHKLFPTPTCIVLLPQSYYGLSVDTPERFESLELGPSLSSPNAGAFIPKYHTFLEGLIHFVVYPPTGLDNVHTTGVLQHMVFVEYLFNHRVGYNEDEEPLPLGQLYPAEREILEELQTEEARCCAKMWFETQLPVGPWKIREELAKHRAGTALLAQSNTANGIRVSSPENQK